MAHTIEIRKIPFRFDESIEPRWHPGSVEWSYMVNGASLAMPYLEPFLIRTLREAAGQIDDEDLLADIRGFNGQEAQHYTQHRKFNELLKTKGYPDLTAVEASFEADYEKLSQRPLAWRLAYCAGFETMTMGITEWLIGDRDRLFLDADPVVTSLVLWHMVEETEHKSVAWDVFQAVSGNYFLRIAGLLHGSLHVAFMSRRGYRAMLRKDGLWRSLRSRARVWGMVGRFLFKAGGAMVRSLAPRYHPDASSDPEWIDQWRAAYSHADSDQLPLLSTRGPTIAPVFAPG